MMKRIIMLTMLIFSAMVTTGIAQDVEGSYIDVEVTEFNDLINSGSGVLIDVRTEDEFAGGHIEGATNVVYSMFGFAGNTRDLDKNETYYIYCKSGVRSGKSLNVMKKLGFKKVYNLTGGIMGWKKNGMPIVN